MYLTAMPHQDIQFVVKECEVVAYRSDGPICKLETDDHIFFDLPVKAIEDNSILDGIILNRTSIVVKFVFSKDEPEQSYDVIEIVDMNGDIHISQDIVSEARSKASYVSLVVIWSICLSYIVFIMSAYYILCNAPKHHRLASLFIRAEYRNF